MKACQLIFDRLSVEIDLTKQGLNVNSADAWYLDLHGDDLKTYRVPGESDESYRIRILDEMLRRRNSVSSIVTALNSIRTEQSAEIYEPWKNLFCVGRSQLSGPDKIIDYDYWNYHVIEVLVLTKPDLVERTLQKIIAASKTLYITMKRPYLASDNTDQQNSELFTNEFKCLSIPQRFLVHHESSDLVIDYAVDTKRLTHMVSTSTINSEEPFSDAAQLGSIQMVYSIKNEIQGVDY